jgi:hypothetical protein
MSGIADADAKIVRHFRQILIWPLQLMPIRADAQIQEHWELLERDTADNPWREPRDEFGCNPEDFKPRHYSEFVTFLPYVRRFLYGDARRGDGSPGNESPIRVFRRRDVRRVRLKFPGDDAPQVLTVQHVDLCFFFDIDIAILVVEIVGDDVDLLRVEDTMFRFGRAYPNYWDADGRAGHCMERVEWLGADDAVLAVSDYEKRGDYLAYVGRARGPRFASHWRYLMRPLVLDHSEDKGLIRYRQVEYSRMPLLAYLAMDDARELTRADFIRIGLVTEPGPSDELPFSERHIYAFESTYCFDQYWNEQRRGRPGTRFISCGHAFAMVGDAHDPFFVDTDGGMLAQFRHQYFLLFLIPHFHKAALAMLSDRIAHTLEQLQISDAESVKEFKRTIRQLREIFLRFTHRYWFHEVSDQPAAKAIYRMTSTLLGSDDLYVEVRDEIRDMAEYLEADTLRRQANTVVRLTVVTVFGLIGTVATGFLGMNLFALAEDPTAARILYFLLVLIPVVALTFYTIVKSKRLSDFLEAMADERLPAKAKLRTLLDVWK